MEYRTKLLYQSHAWYNDGLKKANIRDLTGAIASLKKSLQYDGSNIASRNLLGLVYYGRGEVAEALTEWILSKSIQTKDNIAGVFIQKIKKEREALYQINQGVKGYNTALSYCQQGSEDIGFIHLKKALDEHPTFVKGHQLLTLLYLKTEQYALARQALRKAYQLDTTDEITLGYLHILNQIRKERAVERKRQKEETISYQVGNETIIQPFLGRQKERNRLHTIANILLGLVVGVAIVGFLILPMTAGNTHKKTNQQAVAFGDKIAEQEAQIRALKKELDSYRVNHENAENAQATVAETQSGYETLLNVRAYYNAQGISDEALVEELLKINGAALGNGGKAIYQEMTGAVYPRVLANRFALAQGNMEVANYDTAVVNLERVVQIEEGYQNGQGLLLLSQAYEGKGEKEKAEGIRKKLLEQYPDTEAANQVREASKEEKSN